MNEFLQKVILDNTILSYVICIGSVLLAVLFKRIISKYIATLLFKLLRKISSTLDKQNFIDLLIQPLEVFFVVVVTLVAIDKLNFPQAFYFEVFRVSSKQIIDGLTTAIFFVTFIWMLLRFMDFIALMIKEKNSNQGRSVGEVQMVVFFRDFIKVLIIIFGLLLIIRFVFQKDIRTLLAGLSIVGAAIALAARESLENLIASFIIFFDKPFHVGDVVKVQGITGTVERIGLRSTRIRTDQKTYMTIPNKQMVDSIMDNISLRSYVRVDIKLEIDLATKASIMQEIVKGIEAIVKRKEISTSIVLFNDILPQAYLVTVEYYVSIRIPGSEFNKIKQEINMAVLELLESKGAALAGLTQDIAVHTIELKKETE